VLTAGSGTLIIATAMEERRLIHISGDSTTCGKRKQKIPH